MLYKHNIYKYLCKDYSLFLNVLQTNTDAVKEIIFVFQVQGRKLRIYSKVNVWGIYFLYIFMNYIYNY